MSASDAKRGGWSAGAMLGAVLAARHDPAARLRNVDLLTVVIAVLLPWSTSGVAIASVLWLIAVIPTLDVRAFAQSLKRPICALPIALFVLAAAGTLWSDASWVARRSEEHTSELQSRCCSITSSGRSAASGCSSRSSDRAR